MLITKPLKVLVCLLFVGLLVSTGNGWTYSGAGGTNQPGLEADALSADPRLETVEPARRLYRSPSPSSSRSSSSQAYTRPRGYTAYRSYPKYPSYPVYAGSPGCAQRMAPPNPFQSVFGLFGMAGLPLGKLSCFAFLPRAGCKQFELKARVWYATLDSSNVKWGTQLGVGLPANDVDLHEDLDLGRHAWLSEYEASYQLRGNWAMSYTFMPINFEATSYVEEPGGGIWWGYNYYPNFTLIKSRWQRNINRWTLSYAWYQQRHAVSKVFAGYSLYDDRLELGMPPNIQRVRSVTYGLATAGASIDKVIGGLGAGGIASVHCKWSVQFLEGYFGWDGEAMGRVSIPMNCGRFGYMEAGWRWIVLKRDNPAYADETSLDGLMGSIGLIF